PEIAKSITPRFHLIINLLLLILCYDVGALRSSRYGPAAWMAVTALLFANAVWHLVGAIRTRSYSPGMVTGLLLCIPITVYGYAHLLGAGRASFGTAVVAAALGASYHLGVGKALHDWRQRRA